MNKREIENQAKAIAAAMPKSLNGAQAADLYVLVGRELGMTHLLLPEARPDRFYSIELPETAPELYSERRDRSEGAVGFLKRVYGPWLGQGLARNHMRHLDPVFYHALQNWLRKNVLPDDVDLPTKKELNDRELAQLGIKDGDTLPYPSYYTGLKDRLRLYNAARNRAKRE